MAVQGFQEYPKLIYTDKEKKNYMVVNSKAEEDAVLNPTAQKVGPEGGSGWPPKDFKAD